MDRKARILAGVLGVIAGLLYIYNAIADRQPGESFRLADISMGFFWIALGIYFYAGGRGPDADKRDR